MAIYRQNPDGSYEIQSNAGWFKTWGPADEGWTPSSSDIEYGVAPSNPDHGDYYHTYSGDKMLWDSGSGQWLTTNQWQGLNPPEITGNGYTYTSSGAYNNETDPDRTNPLTLDEVQAERDAGKLATWEQRFADVGGSITYDGSRYLITAADGRKFSTNNLAGVQSIWNDDFYDGPKYSGNLWDPYGDDTVGPLEVNDQFPDGTGTTTPVWVGDGDPPQATISYEDWLAGRRNPYGTGGGAFDPADTTPADPISDPTPDSPWTPGPPQGIPINPIVGQNPMAFSPYGQAAAQFSNIATYGGLPRSTGPWNTPGGYYGGNPYTQMPDGYQPPSQARPLAAPIDSPWEPPSGGGAPDPNRPGPWMPPATPITLPDPLTPEQIAQYQQAGILRYGLGGGNTGEVGNQLT